MEVPHSAGRAGGKRSRPTGRESHRILAELPRTMSGDFAINSWMVWTIRAWYPSEPCVMRPPLAGRPNGCRCDRFNAPNRCILGRRSAGLFPQRKYARIPPIAVGKRMAFSTFRAEDLLEHFKILQNPRGHFEIFSHLLDFKNLF